MKHAEHTYDLALTWEGNQGHGTESYKSYGRGYRARIAGKPDLVGSADPTFLGDASTHNPEDMLVVALSACHMLSYLALCAKYGVSIVSYEDKAHGVMVTEGSGGRFREVTLKPVVVIAAGSDLEKAKALHADANKGCFIAASCNFPVHHEPTVTMAAA